MKVVFRADASVEMGAGHVMRCLTLANALSVEGAQATFICREHPGHLIETIRNQGHRAIALPTEQGRDTKLEHSRWLGATQIADAEACLPYLKEIRPDWLIVDHYGLDADWENRLRPNYRHLMVIDDLADRLHISDVLLDQTYGRKKYDYQALVPKSCRLLCGSQYALLRPDFASLRYISLKRRQHPTIKKILVNMGGTDKDNYTEAALKALDNVSLAEDCEIVVVVGITCPWLNSIKKTSQSLTYNTKILVGVNNMAELMTESDLAIGAAGATTWERCSLGLPSIVVSIAKNQENILRNLEKNKAIIKTDEINLASDIKKIFNNPAINFELKNLIKNSANICDGLGTTRVAKIINEQKTH